MKVFEKCQLCPRRCGVNRNNKETGFCGETNVVRLGRADLHFWEEPCISGENGSGTVFFTGCNLRCCFCQNEDLSRSKKGFEVSNERLSEIFINLQSKGAHNINLVTAEHLAPNIKTSVELARKKGLHIPVILNSNGYVLPETLEYLKNVIDIFLVDFKYMDVSISWAYSKAEDYPDAVKTALAKMIEIAGKPRFNDDGIMKSGVLVRHLCLPSHTKDSKNVIKYVHETYGENIILSVMSQYTPHGQLRDFPHLSGKLSEKEYEEIVDYCIDIGVEDAYIQEGESASESFIPDFDGKGVVFE